MGLLVGLPLKLFHMLFVAIRLFWPLLLALAVWYLLRRIRSGKGSAAGKDREPTFRGPVYTVDYEEVPTSPEEEDP